MSADRKVILGRVSSHWVHGVDQDDCIVEVISLAMGGDGLSLVKCLFSGDKARVPTSSIRP